MRIYFVRHGESQSNVDPKVVGEYSRLTERGQEQASAAAQFLGSVIVARSVYSSPINRAMETADIIARQLGANVVVEDCLREINKGSWQGLPVHQVVDMESTITMSSRHTFRPPGGENWEDVGRRVAGLVENLRKRRINEAVLVSHDHPIRMGIGMLIDRPLKYWEDMPISNGSVTALEYKEGLWRLDPELINYAPKT